MANVLGSGFARWDTAGATAVLPFRNPKIKQIRFEVGATGGLTTLVVDGKTFFSFTMPADSMLDLNYNPAQYMPGLNMTAVGTNVVVVVVYE